MSVSSSCQFVGADSVLRAYVRRGVPSWAIWHNKQFMFKCETSDIDEGEQSLSEHLEALRNSIATYTLCVYEDIPTGGKIKSKTENDGSFNFQLTQREPGGGYDVSLLREIRQAQIEQETRLAHLEDAKNDEPEISGIGRIIGTVKEVMSIPGISDLIVSFLNSKKTVPAAVGYVPENTTMSSFQNNYSDEKPVIEISEIEAARLGAAYANIKTGMPEILEILERLAEISQTQKQKFETIRATIKTFML